MMRESVAALLVALLIALAAIGALWLRSVVHFTPTAWNNLHGGPMRYSPPPSAQIPWINDIRRPQPNRLALARLPRFSNRMSLRWWWTDKPFQKPSDSRLALLCQPPSPATAAQRIAILHTIRHWLNTHDWAKVTLLRNEWLPELLRAGRYNTAAQVCQIMAIGLAGSTGWPQMMMQTRAECFLALNRPVAALRCAVRMYNVCTLSDAPAAIMLIGECLQHMALRADSFHLFAGQQTLGLAYHPLKHEHSCLPMDFGELGPLHQAASTSQPNVPNVLREVPLTPGPYEIAAQQLTGEDYSSLMARGNLYLLADKPRLAAAIFVRAYSLAIGTQFIHAENAVARCLKAQYKLLGPANQWAACVSARAAAPAKQGRHL